MIPRSLCDSRLALLGIFVLLLAAHPVAAGPLQALVPAYFYPAGNSYWSELDNAAHQIGVTAIMNPNSGPGSSADANYAAAVNSLQAAGGRVLGYVYTSYGARSEADVEADINAYVSFYHINGIFLDQQSTSPAEVSYYADLYKYVKSLNPAYQVVANPGTNTQQAYLNTPTADALVTFEDTASAYASYSPASWTSGYSPDHFGNLIHTQMTAAGMLADLHLAQQRNAGLVYVTDDTLPNPYDRLPSYWNQEVAAIAASAAVPEPTSMALLITGAIAAGLLWIKRPRCALDHRGEQGQLAQPPH
jgi:hypothetical protein